MSVSSETAGTRWRVQINPPVFCTSSALTVIFVAFAAAQKEITHSAGWFYVLAVAGFLVFVVLLAGLLPNATTGREDSRLEGR